MAVGNLSKIPFLCIIFTVFFTTIASAKTSAPAPAVDCSSLVLEMADCLSYVTAGGTATKPEGTCCSGLKTVLKTDAECLCETFRNSAQLGVTLNMTNALALPSVCHVSAPSVSNCGLVSIGTAPGLSPLLAPTSSVAGAPAPAGGISANEVSPAPAPTSLGSSGSRALITTSIKLLVLITLFVVSFALF